MSLFCVIAFCSIPTGLAIQQDLEKSDCNGFMQDSRQVDMQESRQVDMQGVILVNMDFQCKLLQLGSWL